MFDPTTQRQTSSPSLCKHCSRALFAAWCRSDSSAVDSNVGRREWPFRLRGAGILRAALSPELRKEHIRETESGEIPHPHRIQRAIQVVAFMLHHAGVEALGETVDRFARGG